MEEKEEESIAVHEVWSWGAGTEGQLGTEKLQDEHEPRLIRSLSTFDPISFISCGGAHVIALTPGTFTWLLNLFFFFFSQFFSWIICEWTDGICRWEGVDMGKRYFRSIGSWGDGK